MGMSILRCSRPQKSETAQAEGLALTFVQAQGAETTRARAARELAISIM